MNLTGGCALLMFIHVCILQDIPKQHNSFDCGVFVSQVCNVCSSDMCITGGISLHVLS